MDGLAGVEGAVRLGAFAGLFLLFAAAETIAPARPRTAERRARWPVNLALMAVNAAAIRLVAPLAAAGAAAWAEGRGFGLLPALGAPGWLAGLIAIAALDLALYLQHRAMHRVPWLWRLHAAHHIDPDVDLTTGVRFHPFEALLSIVLKIAVVAALGAPVWAVIVFEVALNGLALFNHANWRLPAWLERALGGWLITPRAHRLHHDSARAGDAPNLGFSTTLWDRLFGTWAQGAEPDVLGVPGERGIGFAAALSAPFRRGAS